MVLLPVPILRTKEPVMTILPVNGLVTPEVGRAGISQLQKFAMVELMKMVMG